MNKVVNNTADVRWTRIPDTDYKVSDRGVIVASDGNRLRLYDGAGNRALVKLKVKGLVHVCYVDELVAKAFVANPHGYGKINHLDGDDNNNHADNLKWVLKWEKIAARNALKKSQKAFRIVQYSKVGVRLAEFESIYDAAENTGISKRNIYKVVEGINQTANGYIFKRETICI